MGKLALGLRGAAAARGTTSAVNLALTALALVLAAFALRPAGADAASVSVDKTYDRLVVSAGAGERNVLSVSGSGGVFTVVDAGNPLSVGTGCTLVAGSARCTDVPGGPIGYVRILAGDQDDTVSATGVPAFVDAGAGVDRVFTGAGTDYVFGGSGDDVIDAGTGADLISGGDGRDRADYSGRTAAVIVLLNGFPGDGEMGEGDNVTSSVEDVTGGAGADRITGSAGANTLAGGAGDDVLSGAGGNDTLDGNAGRDVLDGGADADTLSSIDGEVDDDRCGLGIDTVSEDAADTVASDCETRRLSAVPGTPAPDAAPVQLPDKVRLTRSGKLRVRVYCALTTGVCRGRLTAVIQRAGTTSTVRMSAARNSRGKSKRFSVKAGTSKAIDVKISRNGRRRVLKDKRTKCRISAVTTNAGKRARSTKVATVEAPEGSR